MVGESLSLLARLRVDPPGRDELHKAQRRYRWDLESTFDDPDAMAGWWGGSELFTPPVSFEEKVARMQSVTPEAISRVADRIFRPERLTVACVGTLRPALEEKVRDRVLAYE